MRCWLIALVALLCLLCAPLTASADCPGNLLTNPGFEGGVYDTATLGFVRSAGTMADGWQPWFIDGDSAHPGDDSYNRRPEWRVLQAGAIEDADYRIYAGDKAVRFGSTSSTHAAGFYQRIPATVGQSVTFSIWVQIYTGQRDLTAGGHPISDLQQPASEAERATLGPGDYRAYVGIDPTGATPASYGAPSTPDIIWSDGLLDAQTRQKDAQGNDTDAWTQISVTTVARADHVTVYTRGRPRYRVKYNQSFWDEACAVVAGAASSAATATPPGTVAPPGTLVPTGTLVPPGTVAPTASVTATLSVTATGTITAAETITATPTPTPTMTPTPTATSTPRPTPTRTPVPTATPVPPTPTIVPPTVDAPRLTAIAAATPLPGMPRMTPSYGTNLDLVMLYLVLAALLVIVILWIREDRKRR